MSSPGVGQRAARGWSSYSLGEVADAVWRVADVLGSGVEPVSVHIEPSRDSEELTWVELVVREPVDVRHIRGRLSDDDELLGVTGTHPDVWTAIVNDTILTVRVGRDEP
jgi:hypothetical protein